jgi:uncharacterized protein
LPSHIRITKETERRFVLGLQGLWPGRRWKGRDGLHSAISECRRIRVDPLNVVGRSHDIALASRVEGYTQADLDFFLYKERAGFEFGGAVSIYPRSLLRLHLSWVKNEGLPMRWEKWYKQNSKVVSRVLQEIEKKGPIEAHEYAQGERVENYRSRRVEGLALYYLWRSMRIMIDHREVNQKFYDLTQRLVGQLPETFPKEKTLSEMAFETLSWLGLSGQEGLPYLRTNEDGRGRSRVTKRQIRQRLIDNGSLTEVEIEGRREVSVLRTDTLPLLEEVASGNVPRIWKPLQPEAEAVFISPLDIVIANERSKKLFDFEYLWEVYKPASKRRWGYYVLPVLFGDRLVGRIEPLVDRSNNKLRIARVWWEKQVDRPTIVEPLARGILRMATFIGVENVSVQEVGPPTFRNSLERNIKLLTR